MCARSRTCPYHTLTPLVRLRFRCYITIGGVTFTAEGKNVKNNLGPDQGRESASSPASEPRPPCEALIANISEVIAILDAEGVNRYKSPNAERLFGWKPEQLVGHSAFDKVHPDDRSAVLAELSAVLATKDGQMRGECCYQHADGQYRWIEYDATNRLNDPNIAGIILSYRDVTQRREAQVSLQRSEQRFRALFEQSAVGYILANSHNEIVEINRAGAAILGYEPSELVGVNGRELIHPDDLEQQPIEEVTEQVLHQNERPEIEHRFRRKSGDFVDVWVKAQAIQLDSGPVEDPGSGGPTHDPASLPSHMITFNDISARKEAERQAAALLKEKELLLREVHHRTKNNLAMLSSMLHVQALNSDNGEVQEALSQAGDRISVMMRIYEQLTYGDSVQEVRLAPVLNRVVNDLVAAGSAAGLHPVIEIEDLVVPVRVSVALAVMVNELVMNVSKYGGSPKELLMHIRVYATTEEQGSIADEHQRKAEEHGSTVLLQVSDNGPGFPADVLSAERQGFGLMIVSALAEQHGGTMRLENRNGGQVTVTAKRA